MNLLVHLRLHFQLLLAPVFLWGWLVAGGGLSTAIILAFVALHVFLYSGATAFNSYFDRDQGPVGGLERPPPVEPGLLPLALAMKAIGWLLVLLVNVPVCAIYTLFALLSVAYSYPRIRLKAHPLASLLTVAFGQGVLAFGAAWAAVRGELASAWSVDGLLGAAAAALLIVGLYPLTQLYQVDEDRARGDRTPLVAWGAGRCFQLVVACQVLGGAALLAVLGRRFGVLDDLLLGLGLAAQVAAVVWLAHAYDAAQVVGTYRRVMRISALSAGGLGAYLLARLALGSGGA